MILYCRQGVLRWAILCLRSLHHKTPRIQSPHHQWHLGQKKWCMSRLLFLFLQPSYQRSLQHVRYPCRWARKGFTKTPWMIAARKSSLISGHFINNSSPHLSHLSHLTSSGELNRWGERDIFSMSDRPENQFWRWGEIVPNQLLTRWGEIVPNLLR